MHARRTRVTDGRGRDRPWRNAWRAGVVLAAALALDGASRLGPEVVERVYSRGLYPWVAGALGALTGWVPRSIAEGLLVGALVALPLGARALIRRARASGASPGGRSLSLLGAGIVMAAALYGIFLLLWGINYRRLPYATLAGMELRPATVGELRSLCEVLVRESNELREGSLEDERGVMRLAGGRRNALVRAAVGFERAGESIAVLRLPMNPPKPVFFTTPLSYLGITGIYVPFTAEANVNVSVPDPDLPFTVSHELAHAQGFAREDEANYLGHLACRLHPDRDFRYSGLLAASLYAGAALAGVDREAYDGVEAARSPRVRRDRAALQAWSERYRGRLSRASQAVNNAYLRSQGQTDGVRSYGRMVDLLLAERRGLKDR